MIKHQHSKNQKQSGSGVLSILMRMALTLAFVVGGAYWFWQWLQDPNHSPIKLVKIHASYNHITKERLQDSIKPHVMDGFFVSSAAELQQRLISMPWTKSVAVQRIWPDTLLVRLIEREPIARWGDSGLIDHDSELFYPDINSLPQYLPKLSGPTVMAPQILATFYKMQQILAKRDLKIAEISVSSRRSWVLHLSNGVKVELGRKHQLLRLEQLMKIWPTLLTRHHDPIHGLDLRYPNGVAVL